MTYTFRVGKIRNDIPGEGPGCSTFHIHLVACPDLISALNSIRCNLVLDPGIGYPNSITPTKGCQLQLHGFLILVANMGIGLTIWMLTNLLVLLSTKLEFQSSAWPTTTSCKVYACTNPIMYSFDPNSNGPR